MSKIQLNGYVQSVSVTGEIVSSPSLACQELIEAFKSPKICVLAPSRIGKHLKDALTKAYYHLGYRAPETEEFLKLQIYLTEFLGSEKLYQTVSIDEVSIAIKRGADRQYKEEFFGIAPATVTSWIRAYMASENRKDAKIIQLHLEANDVQPKEEPTPQEQWDRFVLRLKVLYSNFQSGIVIQPIEAAFCFKILWRSKLIRFDEAARDKMKTKALEQIAKERDPLNATTLHERRKMSIAYDELIEKATEDPQVISRAMALGLIHWFEELKKQVKTIDQAVNEDF